MDKGTLDIMLTKEDGWQRAVRTIKWIYSRMRTPGTLMVVSHSPPDERIDLLSTVYWHSVIFKVRFNFFRGPCTAVANTFTKIPYMVHEVPY